MKYLSQATFMACEGRAWAWCHGLVLGWGLACAALAQAAPPLLVCPGPLFTNVLSPAEAKARGCALAARGRLSQAQDTASQDLPSQAMAAADHARHPAPAPDMSATPNTSAAPGTAATPHAASFRAAVPARSSGPHTSAVSMPVLAATAATPVSMAATPAGAPAASAVRKAPEVSADVHRQRQRDSHAREIVLAELARTQARIQALAAQPSAGPEAESALQRLQRDEDALRRELARRPG